MSNKKNVYHSSVSYQKRYPNDVPRPGGYVSLQLIYTDVNGRSEAIDSTSKTSIECFQGTVTYRKLH